MNRNGNVPAVRRRTVITGVAAFSAAGVQADDFRDAALRGVPLHRPVTSFDTAPFSSKQAAELLGFDPTAYVAPMKLRRMDEVGRLSVAAARTALDAAGWAVTDEGHDGLGVVLGTCTCGVHSTGEFLDRLQALGPTGAPALLFSNTVGNAAASLVALEYRLRGPNTTVSYKEASGAAAIALAVDFVRRGVAQALLTGGAEDIYDLYYKVHDWFGVLSRAGAHPEGARPFDRTRNGFVMGEGAYLLVLEDAEEARARGADVLGEIVGVGASSVVTPINAWPTDASALAWCMRAALDDARLGAGDIGAVYASANGAAVLDAVEAAALHDVFGGHATSITSVKAVTGEGGMASAGAVVAAVLCGQVGKVAPVAGLAAPDPALPSLHLVTGEARRLAAPHVLVNGFASGGTLYSLVLRVS
jgi:3-oxoacyl-[acyl-carrier-protein] synthase II